MRPILLLTCPQEDVSGQFDKIVMKKRNFLLFLCSLFLVCCNSLDDINNRLDKLETDVYDLQSAVNALQKAYDDGKLIKAVTPISEGNSGWTIQFSDESVIRLLNGEDGKNGSDGHDGLTPFLYVDQDGYWCISYDKGEHFTRMMDNDGNFIKAQGEKGEQGVSGKDGKDGMTPLLRINADTNEWEISLDNGESWSSLGVKATGNKGDKGDKGNDGFTPQVRINSETNEWEISSDNGATWTSLGIKATGAKGYKGDKGDTGATGAEGASVRVSTDDNGYYTFEIYKASDPTSVIETITTPFNTNPAYLITGIAEDDVTHIITLTMQNGTTYTFNKVYNTPSSVAILTNRLLIGGGSTATFEFRVNPSIATFNYDVTSPDCEIELDRVGTTRNFNSYVTQPANYKLTKVEQVYDDEGVLKVGQYRAYITDQNLNESYNDLMALVLTVTNGNGEKLQISSSAIQIKYSGSLLTEFKFMKADNASTDVLENVEATIDGNNIVLNTPFILNKAKLVASFKTNGKKVYVGDKEQNSGISINDFSSPLKYTVVSEDGEKNDYTITVNISGLPVVYINTPDAVAITSKENWTKNSTIKIVNTDGSEDYSNSKLQIRGRGNSTWGYPKKPYALKLKDDSEILGMPAHKRWVLLANWMDRTLLRNDVTFQIAKQTCMEWTPRGKFVEVVLNDRHIGNYYLCEQIKVDANRVNIAKMTETDTSGDALTGGYLMELDVYFDEVNKFKSATKNLPYMFKEPDEEVLQPEQLTYFQNYINDLESKLYSDTWLSPRDYAPLMDLNTFADWWFVYELAKNGEPNHPKSCYMHKDRGGVLKAGPVWDFDWGTYTPGTSYTVKNAIYYGRLFSDPAFVTIVKDRWAVLKPQFDAIGTYIRTTAAKIKVSNNINIGLWPISSSVNGDETMSFDAAVDRMVDAYEAKLAWLNTQITAM